MLLNSPKRGPKKRSNCIRSNIFCNPNKTERSSGLLFNQLDEEKLKKDQIKTAPIATATHYEVGTKVRKAIEDIGGTMPEDFPTPEKSIKQIEKEHLKRLNDKKENLILDE